MSACTTPTSIPGDLSVGLVAYYQFENNASDSTGRGHDGTTYGGMSYQPGVLGQAAYFDGIDDFIEVPNHPDFRLLASDDKTFVFWSKRSDLDVSRQYTMLDKHAAANLGLGLQFLYANRNAPSGFPAFYLHLQLGMHVDRTPLASPAEWSCRALVKQGTSWQVYQNGLALDSPYQFEGDTEADIPLRIGTNTEGLDYPFRGWIDELRIYDRALSPSEIQLAAQPPLSLLATSAVDCPGAEVVVPLRTAGTVTLGTMQFSMHWDPAVATFVGVEQIGLSGMSYAENFGGSPAAGVLTLSWDDPAPAGTLVPDGTTLFALRFTLTSAHGASCALTIDGDPVPIELSSPSFEVLETTIVPGQLATLGTFSISGRIGYYAASRAVQGVTLSLTGDTTQAVLSGTDGTYVHIVDACGSYTVTPGKSTDDPAAAGVTMLDASLIRRHVLGIQALPSPSTILAADASGSETITTVDVRLVKQLVLGVRSDFPAGLWRFVRSDYSFPNPLAPWDPEATRTYTDLREDKTGQDYFGIKSGDVNGSWTAGGATAPMLTAGTRAGARLLDARRAPALAVTTQAAKGKGTATASVSARNLDQLTSAQFTLRWDPTVLRFTGVGGSQLPGGGAEDFGTSRVGQGLLSFGWDDPGARGVNAKALNLFTIEFKIVGQPGSSTPIAFSSFPTPQEIACGFSPVAVATEGGVVRVPGDRPLETQAPPASYEK